MNQLKYIFQATFILFIGIILYLIIQKFTKTEAGIAKDTSTVIDYITPEISKSDINGKNLYFINCGDCHGSFDKTDGPWLLFPRYSSRWPDKNELFEFIRHPEKVRKGSTYVKKLEKIFTDVRMKGSPKLSDEEIQSILDYIDHKLDGNK